MRDSSRIEPIPPNIRNDIVSELGLVEHHDWRKKVNETSRTPPPPPPRINKKSIRGDSRDSWPVWNRGIRGLNPGINASEKSLLEGYRRINGRKFSFTATGEHVYDELPLQYDKPNSDVLHDVEIFFLQVRTAEMHYVAPAVSDC